MSGADWTTLESDARTIVQALKPAGRPNEMAAGVASLERTQREARARLEMLLQGTKKAPSEVQNEPHYNTYNRLPYPEKDTVTAPKTCSEPAEPPIHQSAAAESQNRSEKGMVHRIRRDELVRLAPRLKPYLRRLNPTWPEAIDAADWLRHDLDVSKPLWGVACLTMGRDLAAVALAIVSTKDPEHFRTTPGGYFHGMVQKAKAGELHLERTVWAMRRAVQPANGPRNGQGRGP